MKRFFCLMLALVLCLSLLPATGLAFGENGKTKDDYVSLDSLAREHGFVMGASFSYNQTMGKSSYLEFVKTHFSSITCTNETKAYSLLDHKACMASEDGMPVMNYWAADKMVKWAQDNGLKVRGHVLVWDAYMNDWFFRVDYDPNKPYADQETMRARTRSYIEQVITHFEEKFPGVIYCWDVVNEAIGDNASEWDASDARHLRTIRSGVDNLFKTHLGNDYVEFSFLCAKDTVEALGADITLFYNDYNMFFPEKRDAALALIDSINHYAKDENGEYRKLIDGAGMQGYIGGYGVQDGCLEDSHLENIATAIRMYGEKGLEVHITEMAVRNFVKTDEMAAKHADYYARLFQVFIDANAGDVKPLTCVAIWGLTDNPTAQGYVYNLNSPYGGLITEKNQIKTSFDAVHAVLNK
ncbi:MAG: endo-1,4-beta-xylanase [Clostridia bacterium]|nr:endo-1,4-beta-xylanase [Clostridia bacterium]